MADGCSDVPATVIDEEAYRPGNPALAASGHAVVLTGCSGGGKSTLLSELARRGHRTVPEAGRQIVREQMHVQGDALPWSDASKFVALAASRLIYFFNSAQPDGRVIFFDRSLVDLTSFLEMKGIPVPAHLVRALDLYRFAPTVFVTPPWREIYVEEAERSKSFEDACREYEALVEGYRASGYRLVELPKTGVAGRADFVERALGLT